MQKRKEWIERAISDKKRIIAILFDQEEKDYYPIYFDTIEECKVKIKGLTISIYRQKLIEIIEVEKMTKSKTKKSYVLDTNVLIQDPKCLLSFQEHDIYLPIYVLEELDKFKGEQTSRGMSSREVIRFIDSLRVSGDLRSGIDIDKSSGSGKLFVYCLDDPNLVKHNLMVEDTMDNRIVMCALTIKEKNPNTILVTMDINLRIRAASLGLKVAAYEHQAVDSNTLKNRVIDLMVSPEDIDKFFKVGFFEPNKDMIVEHELEYNSCINLTDGKSSALGRFYIRQGQSSPSINNLKISKKEKILGLSARNREQLFALDMLLDDNIKFLTIMGNAGSGKSILSIAASLKLVLEDGLYNKMLVSRPVVPMGKDIGFLPGSVEEKLKPYMQPIYDNLEYLLMSGSKGKSYKEAEALFEDRTIEIEPLVYIRGRSIPNQIMLVDEAQSLNSHEVKTIITRCGENTKIIFTGDINQIDNPYVSASTNGLSIAVKKMRNHPLVGHIQLEKGERSPLANLAIESL